jgi:Site-specific recombinase XerD
MKKGSIVYQAKSTLQEKLKIGSSRHADKALGITHDHIYSWKTYNTYRENACNFAEWARTKHGCKTLDEAREYAGDYIKGLADGGYAAPTQKVAAAALAKLYGCPSREFGVKTKEAHRKDITRSRGKTKSDRHFSEENNKELIDFCRATGLRRSELEQLRSEQLRYDDKTGLYSLEVKGKGGRVRISPILSQEAVERIKGADGLVWPRVHAGADVHSFRADYVATLYKSHARQREDIPPKERYCCKGDMAGIWFDKPAMRIVSNALGHTRIDVIAQSYLYSL